MRENILFIIALALLAGYMGWLLTQAWQLTERRVSAEIRNAAVLK